MNIMSSKFVLFQEASEGNVTVLSESTLPVMTFDNGQLKDLLVKGGQIVIQDGGSLNSSTISFTTRLTIINY